MSTTRIRLDPGTRREQLLDLGTRLLATRTVDELSVDLLAEEAGVSRGLLYHYFGTKRDFHAAVVRRAVDQLIAITAPRDIDDPLEQLTASLEAYVDYVQDNYAGYVSLVRAAGGGNEEMRNLYLTAREALTSRMFEAAGDDALVSLGIIDSPATRLLVDGWAAMVEEVVIAWTADDHGLTKTALLASLVGSLPAILRPSSDPQH